MKPPSYSGDEYLHPTEKMRAITYIFHNFISITKISPLSHWYNILFRRTLANS